MRVIGDGNRVQQAKAAYKAAKKALDAYRSPDGKETEEYLRLNKAVLEAEKLLRWYQR